MVRLDRGGTLVNVRVRAVVLLSAFAIPLLFPVTSYALSVDPLLDTVRSVAKLHESENTPSRDNGRGSNKHEDKAPVSSSSPSNKSPDVAVISSSMTTQPEPAIIPAPIEKLQPIDTAEMQPQTLQIYRPVATLTASQEILGSTTSDSVAPLQASAHGWKLFNVAWYWWLVGGISAFYGIQRVVRYRQFVKIDTI